MAAPETIGNLATAAWRKVEPLLRLLSRGVVAVMVAVLRVYQRVISPGLRPCCRFTPSCSAYAVESLRKHGPVVGLLKGLWRVCRCHPLGGGGYDPP
jgi:putative membrane protein insertion efficiency factor